MISKKMTDLITRLAIISVILVFLMLGIGIVSLGPVDAQTDLIYDQELFTYPAGSFSLITHTDFYSGNARVYSAADNRYAEYELDSLASNTRYLIYAWVRDDPSYGVARYTVDGLYLNALDFAGGLPNDWNLVGDITTTEPDVDPPVLVIDRADTGSGSLVVDAVKLVATTTAAAQEPPPLDNWYLAGGIPDSCVLGAYQPMGANDLADSYINLNDPGVNDLTTGTVPGWNETDGWVFQGVNYLNTSIAITKSMSIMVRARYGQDDDDFQYVASLFEDPIGIGLGLIDSLYYFSKGFSARSYTDTLDIEHVFGIAYLDDGNSYSYIDGAKQAHSLGSADISSPYNLVIGAQSYGTIGLIAEFMVGTVQAIAFYDCALTEAQVQAVSDAMIGTPIPTTVSYTLPTTGDPVLYHRELNSGEIMIAAPLYGLGILLLFREIWRVAKGGG